MERAAIATTGALLVLTLATQGANAASTPEYISAAVADSARPDADKQRDADRKPAETLAFAGVKPGDKVVELVPGKGYYTRLLSAVVGPKGTVYAVVPPPKPDAAPDAPAPGAAVQAIAKDPHYGNVKVLVERIGQLDVPEKVDLAWTSQNYHDFHNVPDLKVFSINREVWEALHPAGIYFVLDHSAALGSGTRDTNTLHRIDRNAVVEEVTSAGFELSGESDLLSNKADPRTAKVFDPSIRGHTDQFLLKFRKTQ
jgi:predicted methyltransferase